MLLGTRKTLYDHIIEALLGKPMNVSQIQEYLDTQKIPATIQGVYKALRELIREDIVVKQKTLYLISSVWRNRLNNLVSNRSGFKLLTGERLMY